jgi:exodeoxyribonuclease V alpha subunit
MQETTVKGTVHAVHFANPDSNWMAGKIRLTQPVDGKRVLGFSGKIVADVGDEVELSGTWGLHPKYGKQFEASTGLVKMNESPDALVHLLATHDSFKGLGPSRARKVVDAALMLSDDGEAASALVSYPEEIAERAGVDVSIVNNAAEVWGGRKGHFDAMAVLGEQGWTNTQSAKILTRLGENAPALVKGDPYMLIGKLERFGFRTVDAVARKMGISANHPTRLASGVAFCLDRIADNGSTWTTKEALTAEAITELRPDTLDAEDLIVETIEQLIVSGLICEGKTPEGEPFLADAQLAKKEAAVFGALLNGMNDFSLDALSFNGERATAARAGLKAGQAAAVRGFAVNRVSVISGGAGVGKTYTMKAICEIAEENRLRVALCAPTGKAARKLAQSTQRKAKTIHRLLEPLPDHVNGGFNFTRGNANPVEFDLVVVDEVSMVDVRLMFSLLAALPARCRLLLVGDHNQIPSVGPGAVLRDLLAAKESYPTATNVLTEIVRQAGPLAVNTTAILDGVVSPESSAVWGVERSEPGNEAGTPGIIAALIESIATSPTATEPFGRTLDFAWDIQVLAPMKKGPVGTYAINVELQRLRQRLLGNAMPEPTTEGRSPKPLMGDRIIWTKNDYELDLMNGTQAIVVGLPKGGAMKIRTEDGTEVLVPSGKRKNVEVAYAMTIHKAQGSEWPLVVLAISSAHWYMRDRNLFYTGASRASESLTIVGDATGIHSYASAQRSEQRKTLGAFAVRGWDFIAQGVVVAPAAHTIEAG